MEIMNINNIERVLFIPEKLNLKIEYFWLIKDTSYLLIMTGGKNDYTPAKIHLISSKTKQQL